MNDLRHAAWSSRRRFLRDVSVMSAAAAGIVKLSETAEAARRSPDQLQKIELGVKPDMTCPGGVVVKKPRTTFLTFFATELDEAGLYLGEGTAVIQLKGCVTWNIRCAGDEEFAAHPVDLEQLDVCQTYEVVNSTWLKVWREANGATKISSNTRTQRRTRTRVKPQPLRHFIFTFFGHNPGLDSSATHFECLARELIVDFFPTEMFDEILDYISFIDSQA